MTRKINFKATLFVSSILAAGFAFTPSAAKAAFEWTPPAKEIEKKIQPPVEPALPVMDIEQETMTPPLIEEELKTEIPTDKAPVQYIEGEAPKEMVLKVPADSEVAEELKGIIDEANENNVITPTAAIPDTEKLDVVEVPEVGDVPEKEMMPLLAEEKVIEAEKTDQLTAEIAVSEEPEIQEITASAENPDIVKGFGKDLPLVMAIRQILPKNSAYSFGEGIDLATPVSWEGGLTWQETITNIANANNMDVSVTDKEVRLSSKGMIAEIAPAEEIISVSMGMTEVNVMPQEDQALTEALVEVDTSAIMAEGENVIESDLDTVVIVSPMEDMKQESATALMPSTEAGKIVSPVEETVQLKPQIEEMTETVEAAINSDIQEMDAKVEELNAKIMEEEAVAMNAAQEMDMPEVTIITPEEAAIEKIDEEMPLQITEEIKEMPALMQESVQDIAEPIALVSEKRENNTNAVTPAMIKVTQHTDDAPMTEMDMASSMVDDIAAPMPAAVMDVKTWKVKKNSDLKSILSEWSVDNGVAFQWNMNKDYQVGYMVWVDGRFEEAVQTLMQGYSNEPGIIPSASFAIDDNGQPLLVIEPAA